MGQIKQMIVVEGRDDTKRLREAFGSIDTIETNGSAINEATLEKIKLAQASRGVIVLTDPDFPGEKIRRTISQAVPGVTHAFLPRADAVPDHQGSLGVEHANPEALRVALSHLFTEVPDAEPLITKEDLITAGFIGGAESRKRRERLGELLHIGYANGKQLERRLAQFQIPRTMFAEAVLRINAEEANNG